MFVIMINIKCDIVIVHYTLTKHQTNKQLLNGRLFPARDNSYGQFLSH